MRDYDIFISYSWKDKDEVDKIDKDFQAFGITFTRDERDLSYHRSIKEFMKRVRKADYALMVISDTYLKSRNCMYEVMEFIKDDDYKDRILHIILDNCKDIFTPAGRAKYVAFWEDEYNKTKEAISSLDPMNADDLYKDLKVIENICRSISGFISTVSDMLCVPLDELKAKGYKPILDFIEPNKETTLHKTSESNAIIQNQELVYKSLQTDTDAICIERIINPPKGENKQISAIYISAKGSKTYIIDSIALRHKKGMSCSMGSGSFKPDAEYVFPFEYGSYEIHPLIPALVINPNDHREIFFSIGLYPKGSFPSCNGDVQATLNYHIENSGIHGTLKLETISKEAILLSSLFESDIEIDNMIITSTGLQKGKAKNGTQLCYKKIKPPWFSYYDLELPGNIPIIVLTKERMQLNKVIEDRELLPKIFEYIDKGEEFAFDLCAGLPDIECTEKLLNATSMESLVELALVSLTVRHFLYPSETLAKCVLDMKVPLTKISPAQIENISTALLLYPKGEWVKALLELAKVWHTPLDAIYIRRSELLKAQIIKVEQFCFSEFEKPFPNKTAIKLLLWKGHAANAIKSKLQNIPPTVKLSKILDNSQYYRNNLIKELNL